MAFTSPGLKPSSIDLSTQSKSPPPPPASHAIKHRPRYRCSFCWRLFSGGHRALRSRREETRIACEPCWRGVVDLSVCWVCGDVVVGSGGDDEDEGDDEQEGGVVGFGWCFWHWGCFSCLVCRAPMTPLAFEDRSGQRAYSGRRYMDLTKTPLCQYCERELAGLGEPERQRRAVHTVSRVDGGLARLRKEVLLASQFAGSADGPADCKGGVEKRDGLPLSSGGRSSSRRALGCGFDGPPPPPAFLPIEDPMGGGGWKARNQLLQLPRWMALLPRNRGKGESGERSLIAQGRMPQTNQEVPGQRRVEFALDVVEVAGLESGEKRLNRRSLKGPSTSSPSSSPSSIEGLANQRRGPPAADLAGKSCPSCNEPIGLLSKLRAPNGCVYHTACFACSLCGNDFGAGDSLTDYIFPQQVPHHRKCVAVRAAPLLEKYKVRRNATTATSVSVPSSKSDCVPSSGIHPGPKIKAPALQEVEKLSSALVLELSDLFSVRKTPLPLPLVGGLEACCAGCGEALGTSRSTVSGPADTAFHRKCLACCACGVDVLGTRWYEWSGTGMMLPACRRCWCVRRRQCGWASEEVHEGELSLGVMVRREGVVL
ncbi:MAG: hypothetical protein M1829_000398 [Trizodia sp. TS-e1964]|nr:MAG: hypothetical protein M1829_000398 [Trizodia sp. TS-e1964]